MIARSFLRTLITHLPFLLSVMPREGGAPSNHSNSKSCSAFVTLASALTRSSPFADDDNKASPAVPRRLQPGLRRGGALLPFHNVVHLLERQPDIVEAFEQPRAVGRRDVESDI